MTVTSSWSQYFENAQLNWLRGTTFPAAPTTLYFALFTVAPVNGVDSGATEVSGTSYVRKSMTSLSTLFAAPSGAAPASIVSVANIVWASPGGAWGTVVGWAAYDAVSAGNLIA